MQDYDLRACSVSDHNPVIFSQNFVSSLCSVYCHRGTKCPEQDMLMYLVSSAKD